MHCRPFSLLLTSAFSPLTCSLSLSLSPHLTLAPASSPLTRSLSLPIPAGSPARAYPYSGEGVAGAAEAMPVNRLLGGVPGHMRAGQAQALAQVRPCRGPYLGP